MMDFVAWPKIPRLHKDIVVTEKIDGTNAAVIIEKLGNGLGGEKLRFADQGTYDRSSLSTFLGKPGEGKYAAKMIERGGELFLVGAQSRNRLITPEVDNAGFARWAFDNADQLLTTLGVGRHYGEWWGSGIQRGYGLTKGEKRFSLFNGARYPHLWDPDHAREDEIDSEGNELLPALGVVPVLYEGPFSEQEIEDCMQALADEGSHAAPGFKPPEGVVVFHSAAQQVFKWTFEDAPKGNSSLTAAEAAILAAQGGALTRTNGECRA